MRDYFKVVGVSWLALVYLDRVDGRLASGAPLRLTGVPPAAYDYPARREGGGAERVTGIGSAAEE